MFLAACATGTPGVDGTPDAKPGGGKDAGGEPTDAATADASSPPIDASPPPPAGTQLLLTEVVLTPSTGEYIEIANPTAQTVDLSTYYVSDAGSYFRLPAGAPTVDSNDFIAKFPAGATLAPGAVATIALDTAANFQTVYGVAPTYSLADGTITSVAANGLATLTNAGELVVLFQWAGQSDLVSDVDLVLAGVPSVANGIVDKSAVSLDGPDADATPSAYSADARTITAQPTAPGAGKSTKRIALETGHETQAGGGNGITGDDETSEQTSATWDTTYTAPTPGAVPAGLF